MTAALVVGSGYLVTPFPNRVYAPDLTQPEPAGFQLRLDRRWRGEYQRRTMREYEQLLEVAGLRSVQSL
jgi:hypothetical protein